MKLHWYFDFISPFAYLQHCQFDRLPENCEVVYKPILFAGLLNHWQNVGPAEVPPKRIFTYKHCYWRAQQLGIEFRMPPTHPFNPLSALRLAIALKCQPDAIQLIFEFVWRQGNSFEDRAAVEQLCQELRVDSLENLITQDSVKLALRNNTEEAATENVFGVPTFVPQDQMLQNGPKELFWGIDSFEMLLDYIQDPNRFSNEEMQRISQLPEGLQRTR